MRVEGKYNGSSGEQRGVASGPADFAEHIVPPAPRDEVPRDAQVRQIIAGFGPESQTQMVAGGMQAGKTNLLAQFVRQCRGRCACYFITPSPLTQRQDAFLFGMCWQLSRMLGTQAPPERMALEELKSLFAALCFRLANHARATRIVFYFVVDGLERALSGPEGDRILDLFPLQTSAASPYLLFSCRSDRVNELPAHVKCEATEPMSFSRHETNDYLSGLGLSQDELAHVHRKYQGVPGYLRIIKEARRADPDFDTESAPAELDRLVREQVQMVLDRASDSTRAGLRLLASCPASLPASALSELVGQTELSMVESLRGTGLIRYDSITHRAEFANELAQRCVRELMADETNDDARILLDHLREKYADEDLLLTLLFEETKDYEGLTGLLSERAITGHIDATGDICGVLRTMRTASAMAKDRGNTRDLVKWTLGVAAAKSFVSHAVSTEEISALAALGEWQEALTRAYAVPEISARIRLLARTYAAMKEHDERVQRSAKEELAAMVARLDVENLERDMVQKIAVDLFPVLPDASIAVLERAIGEAEQQSIVEVAIEAVEASLQQRQRRTLGLAGAAALTIDRGRLAPTPAVRKAPLHLGYIDHLLSAWLQGLPLSSLVEELRRVQNAKAREYLLREWCRENAESDDIGEGIVLWVETVVGNRQVALSLRGLRQISEILLARAPDLDALIDRLRVPEMAALDSPKQEWVAFHLNIAEALLTRDPEAARQETLTVQDDVLTTTKELDVTAFCLARLWAGVNSMFPGETKWIRDLERHFDEAFRALLGGSAEQLEALLPTLRVLVDVDPTVALAAAAELNTHDRRTEAISAILQTALAKQGGQDVAGMVASALEELEKPDRDSTLVRITSWLGARGVPLDPANLRMLCRYSRDIHDPTLKAQAMSELAWIAAICCETEAPPILEEAVEAWRLEDDLKIRLSLGFGIVETSARIDLERAKELHAEVEELRFQPGSVLAAGELGSVFTHAVDLAIRAICPRDVEGRDETLPSIESLILRIPCSVVRVQQFAALAANVYRAGNAQCANDLVRTRVIPSIKRMDSRLDRSMALRLSLPIIYEYDSSTARALAGDLPYSARDEAWYSTVLWTLSRSHLGDHWFEPEHLRVKSDYPRLQRSVQAAGQIENDRLLCRAIAAAANSVAVSFESMIDLAQALSILQSLDELASAKLPERSGKNIRHDGYLLLAQAEVHAARSRVYHKARRKRGLSAKSIRERWQQIHHRARRIPNAADRVFVMALLAPLMAEYYRRDASRQRELLETAESALLTIPTVIDRVDRLETIGRSWGLLGEKSQAEVVLTHAFALADQLEVASADDRLRMLVQAAYVVSPDLADDLVARFDTRLPGASVPPGMVAVEVEKLRSDPSRVKRLSTEVPALDTVFAAAAGELLSDFAAGRGTVVDTPLLEDWLANVAAHTPRAIVYALQWVVESLERKARSVQPKSSLHVFLDVAQMAHELAKYISTARGEGIPDLVHDSFPGLSATVKLFRSGDVERAKTWVQEWLRDNAKEYVKVCDPYFGPDELEYLVHLPLECRALIVTTDKHLTIDNDPVGLRSQLELQWRNMTSRRLPQIQLMIVPEALEDRFHDRAIVTRGSGLDLGQSLNGLGRTHGKITVLNEEDAGELERAYVDEMLSNATWFLAGVKPVNLFLGA